VSKPVDGSKSSYKGRKRSYAKVSNHLRRLTTSRCRKGGREMLRKNYSKTGASCRVTFDLPPGVNAEAASLCGEFNDWSPTAHPMGHRKDGRFSTTISLQVGETYRFRYLLDGERWENDWGADGYMPNPFGDEDSLIKL
jgi:1,4-alpha-glucan branching enzyme